LAYQLCEPRLDGSDPAVAVAMPTLNRAKYLPKVLEALHACSYPRNRVRLIFVDGYSTDETFQMLRDFAENHRGEYEDIILIQDKGNIPAARNLCIRNIGSAKYLVFVDSDVMVAPDFLGRLIGLSHAGEITSIFYSSFSYEQPKPSVRCVETVSMGCTLIKRDVLDKIGPFDTTLSVNEDTDYCLRARKLGCNIVQDTTVQFLHQDEGRYKPEQIIWQSIKYRRGYAKIFGLGIYRKRLMLYLALDLATFLGLMIHPLFLTGITAYFMVQLARRHSLKLAFYLTVNSLIISPLVLLGLIERMRSRWQGKCNSEER
jgi:glycosyltransferase involved in cell wall biosynthesis